MKKWEMPEVEILEVENTEFGNKPSLEPDGVYMDQKNEVVFLQS